METLLVFVLVLVVVWIASRQGQAMRVAEQVDMLSREMDRLRDRVSLLERAEVKAPQAATANVAAAKVASVADAPVREVVKEEEPEKYRVVYTAPAEKAAVEQEPVEPVAWTAPGAGVASAVAGLHSGNPANPHLQKRDVGHPEPVVVEPKPQVERVVAAPVFGAVEAEPVRRRSLEERLGQNWLNKLGIVTLVTGLALFLGYQLRSLGPLGKSLLGVGVSAAILGVGLVLERKERYRIFARAAIGGGWALLYFVTFALYHVTAMQVLRSQAVDLVLMLAVAGGMVAHSLRYRSQVVTGLAFLLAFFTVSISHVTMFSLVTGAILAAGLVVVAFRERWFALALGGLVASYLNHFLWLQRMLPDGASPRHPFAQFVPSAALLLFDWLLFRVFYIFCVPETEAEQACSALNVLVNSTGLLALLKFQSAHPEWAFRGLIALGLAELGLAFVARRRQHRAFVMLACIASVLLVAAVPFRFSGASWSMGWLLESELLFVAGVALGESVFRRLGVLSGFAAIGHLLVSGALPVWEVRQAAADPLHHAALAIAFATAAVLAWINAEVVSRRWPVVAAQEIDHVALRVLSYCGAACAAVAIWVAMPAVWVVTPWLALAIVLVAVGEKLRSTHLVQQADALAVAAVLRVAVSHLYAWGAFPWAANIAVVLSAVAALYVLMRRTQDAYLLRASEAPVVYSWGACVVLAALGWFAVAPAAVSVAWAALGVVLLELGLALRKPFLRQQAAALLAASFVRVLFLHMVLAEMPRMYMLLLPAAAYAWTYQRLYASGEGGRLARVTSQCAAWMATASVAILLAFHLPQRWMCVGAAGMAVALLVMARVLRRRLFTAQALVFVALTAAAVLLWNLREEWGEQRLYTIGLTCLLLLAALPVAYAVRGQQEGEADENVLAFLLRQPEQVFFFAPLGLLTAFLAVALRAGMITVGWSALGLAVFLFALLVHERSFRLAGLGLLMLGVAKILAIDVWHASATDRYITLIVMGGALLLVSFLYSRYRETILKLL